MRCVVLLLTTIRRFFFQANNVTHTKRAILNGFVGYMNMNTSFKSNNQQQQQRMELGVYNAIQSITMMLS